MQGPIIPAAQALSADVAKTAMGIAGVTPDQYDPAVLGFTGPRIAGLNARDIMGYCIMALLFSGIIISLGDAPAIRIRLHFPNVIKRGCP